MICLRFNMMAKASIATAAILTSGCKLSHPTAVEVAFGKPAPDNGKKIFRSVVLLSYTNNGQRAMASAVVAPRADSSDPHEVYLWTDAHVTKGLTGPLVVSTDSFSFSTDSPDISFTAAFNDKFSIDDKDRSSENVGFDCGAIRLFGPGISANAFTPVKLASKAPKVGDKVVIVGWGNDGHDNYGSRRYGTNKIAALTENAKAIVVRRTRLLALVGVPRLVSDFLGFITGNKNSFQQDGDSGGGIFNRKGELLGHVQSGSAKDPNKPVTVDNVILDSYSTNLRNRATFDFFAANVAKEVNMTLQDDGQIKMASDAVSQPVAEPDDLPLVEDAVVDEMIGDTFVVTGDQGQDEESSRAGANDHITDSSNAKPASTTGPAEDTRAFPLYVRQIPSRSCLLWV